MGNSRRDYCLSLKLEQTTLAVVADEWAMFPGGGVLAV